MPELPEVETVRKGLQRRVVGVPIVDVEVRKAKIVRGVPKTFQKELIGSSITTIRRRGKLLVFVLSVEGRYLLTHLKMTGQLIYQRGKKMVGGGHPWPPLKSDLPNKHTHVVISFKDGGQLFFNDLRQFGFMEIVGEERLKDVLSRYGIEPLSKQFTEEAFGEALRRRAKTSVKAALLDQRLIAGLGNIYVDEVCFLSGVRPGRRVSTMTRAEKKRMFQAIPTVLTQAIEHGGTTFEHFRDSEGNKGNFTKLLKAYGRAGLPCTRCGTVMVRTVVAQRGTTYCPACQR